MKIDRLLAIILHLVTHKKVKAKDLAQKFDVSVRTIYRDLNAIEAAGIPITTYQGVNGGIGIIEGYKIDKTVFTKEDINNILIALKGINSISNDNKIKTLIDKVKYTNTATCTFEQDEILIDLTNWYCDKKTIEFIGVIKKAIRERLTIDIVYNKWDNTENRKINPYTLVLKNTNWYVYAYCFKRQDFRLFKIQRIEKISFTDQMFIRKEIQLDRISWDNNKIEKTEVVEILFDKSIKNIAIDVFGIEKCKIIEGGRVRVVTNMKIDKWIYGFLLGFGSEIEIVQPEHLKLEIKDIARKIYEKYL